MVATRTPRARNILAMAAALLIILVGNTPAIADEHGVVGQEVLTSNTPGGGGGLTSAGLTGERTPWSIAQPAPTTGGTGIINIGVTYYHCKECRDAALKKQKEDAEKAKEAAKAKAAAKKAAKTGAKPPVGPDVITFDPRTHELVDGKVVPKRQHSLKAEDHNHCDKPGKFECGEHFQWWLDNHEHRNTSASKPSDADPRILVTGSVVAGEEATVCVRNPNGTFLEGVVVASADGQRKTTDKSGRATFTVPKGIETLLLTLAGTQVGARAFVRESAAGLPMGGPGLVQAGQEAPIVGSGANSGQLTLDGKQLEILASSPTGVVAQIPHDLAPGVHTLLWSSSDASSVRPMESISFTLAPPKTLAVGQRSDFKIEVSGCDQPIPIRLVNHSPSVIKLAGSAERGTIVTAGGKPNFGTIPVQTLAPGAIKIGVQIAPSAPFGEVCRESMTPEAQMGVDRATAGAERVAGRIADGLPAAKGTLAQGPVAVARVASLRKWMQARDLWLGGQARDAKKAEADALKLEGAGSVDR